MSSFLNVVIYRLPEGLSLLNSPSRCSKFCYRSGGSENVPWL